MKLLNALVGLIVLSLLGPPGKITVKENPLTVGDSIEVEYENPNRANQIVTVEIDNGKSPPTTFVLPIQLDATGKGKATWTVPHWDSAAFNAPDAREVFRMISDPDGGGGGVFFGR